MIEPSVGLDRLMLAVLVDGYTVERGSKGGERVVLRLSTDVAPVRAAVLPLKSNHAEQVELATQLQAKLSVRSPIQASILPPTFAGTAPCLLLTLASCCAGDNRATD